MPFPSSEIMNLFFVANFDVVEEEDDENDVLDIIFLCQMAYHTKNKVKKLYAA